MKHLSTFIISIILILSLSVSATAKIDCIDIPKGINQYAIRSQTSVEMQDLFPQSLGRADMYEYANGFVVGQVLFDNKAKAIADLDAFAQKNSFKKTMETVCEDQGYWKSNFLKEGATKRVGSMHFIRNKCVVFIEAPELIGKETSAVRLTQMICQRSLRKELVCNDGQDNDKDGRTDCGDSDCADYCGRIAEKGASQLVIPSSSPAKECKKLGEVTMEGDLPCCAGLKMIQYCDFKGNCYDDFSYCLPCGNNVCDELENEQNCAIDCAPETISEAETEDIAEPEAVAEQEPVEELSEIEKKIAAEKEKDKAVAQLIKMSPSSMSTIIFMSIIFILLFLVVIFYLYKRKH
ncbi:hypothetical protein KY336_02145 [Candidatus Woesearchaeota archaeon]|nr:hypothetical protein [Candidatus Woesearchaeota archaeon]